MPRSGTYRRQAPEKQRDTQGTSRASVTGSPRERRDGVQEPSKGPGDRTQDLGCSGDGGREQRGQGCVTAQCTGRLQGRTGKEDGAALPCDSRQGDTAPGVSSGAVTARTSGAALTGPSQAPPPCPCPLCLLWVLSLLSFMKGPMARGQGCPTTCLKAHSTQSSASRPEPLWPHERHSGSRLSPKSLCPQATAVSLGEAVG